MALINIDSRICKLIRKDAIKNKRGIGEQAHYYILVGKFLEDLCGLSVDDIKIAALKAVREFKTTR